MHRLARFFLAGFFTAVSILTGSMCPPALAQDKGLTVFAAASMKNALDDINAAYTARTGVKIVPGMVLVGKLGKSSTYHESAHPSPLEVQGLPFSALCSLYGHLWKNTSLYSTEEHCGTVESAYFEKDQGRLRAVVELVQV